MPASLLNILAVVLLLLFLTLIGIGACLSKEKLNKEKYFFLGFIILLFTIIYAVSILNYDISDKGVRVRQLEEEVTEVSDIVAWVLGNLSRGGDRKSYEKLMSLRERIKNPEMARRVSQEVQKTGKFYDSEKVKSLIKLKASIFSP